MKSKITALFSLVLFLTLPLCRGQTVGGQWTAADGSLTMSLELQKFKNDRGVPFYVDRRTGRTLVDIGTNLTFTGTVNTATNNDVRFIGQTVTIGVTNTMIQARTYSTNIVLASATTPVVLGGGTAFTWLTVVGNSVGRVANTNIIYLQTQADNGTNGMPIAAGGSVTLTMSPNRFDYLSNYWVGGVVGGADVFWGY